MLNIIISLTIVLALLSLAVAQFGDDMWGFDYGK